MRPAFALLTLACWSSLPVRHVVHAHLNEIRGCYERLLLRDASAAGRVVVYFVVGASGRVERASIESSTLGDAPTEQCIARAVAKWEFPPVRDGGGVFVHYPFTLQPTANLPRLSRPGPVPRY